MFAAAAPASDLSTDKPPRRRRWVPLSLRLHVALLVILGVVCAWEGMRGYRHLTAIHEVELLGGVVKSVPRGNAWLRGQIGNDWSRMLDDVPEVFLNDLRISDDTLRHVGRLKGLKLVLLGSTSVSESGIAHLKSRTGLMVLEYDPFLDPNNTMFCPQGPPRSPAIDVPQTQWPAHLSPWPPKSRSP